MAVNERWTHWPALPELFPVSFSGVKTARDGFLTDIDLDRLKARIADYFNPTLSHEEIARRHPIAMQPAPRFTPHSVRDTLLARGGPKEDGFIRYAYRPFDDRWLYWEGDTKLLDEKRADYRPHIFPGNLWLSSSHRIRKGESEPQTAFTSNIASYHLIERVANWFPAWLRHEGLALDGGGAQRRPNLSAVAQRYLDRPRAGGGGPVPPRAGGAARTGLPEGQPPGRCGWSGPASRCLAGPTATRPALPMNCAPPLPWAESWPPCWTRRRRCRR